MQSPRIAALLSAAVLTVGGAGAVLAQTGAPELPDQAADNAAEAVESASEAGEAPESAEETSESASEATRTDEARSGQPGSEEIGSEEAEFGGAESEEADDEASAFSRWVRSLEVERCRRGLSVAAAAHNKADGEVEPEHYDQYIIDEGDAPCLQDRGAASDVEGTRSGGEGGHDRGRGGPPEGVPGGPPAHANAGGNHGGPPQG